MNLIACPIRYPCLFTYIAGEEEEVYKSRLGKVPQEAKKASETSNQGVQSRGRIWTSSAHWTLAVHDEALNLFNDPDSPFQGVRKF